MKFQSQQSTVYPDQSGLCGVPILAPVAASPYEIESTLRRMSDARMQPEITSSKTLTMKALISEWSDWQPASSHYQFTIQVVYFDNTDVQAGAALDISLSGITDLASLRNAIQSAVLTNANSVHSYGMTAADIIWAFPATGGVGSRGFATASRSIVTGTGATGFQVSATRDAQVSYSTTIVTTATIAGGQDGTIVLEIAPTNSATPGDWVEIGRFRNGQALSLALALQSVQTTAGVLAGVIPAGYYAKLRSINGVGTPSFAFNSGQEVLL